MKYKRFIPFHKLPAFQQIKMIVKNRLIQYLFKDRFGSFLQVGDIVNLLCVDSSDGNRYGKIQEYTIEKLQIVPNGCDSPTEVVIVIALSYNDGRGSVECTLDRFKYLNHLYPSQEQVQKRIDKLR